MEKFKRGNIVRVCLNLTVGRETQGDFRPALVLSSSALNSLVPAFVVEDALVRLQAIFE